MPAINHIIPVKMAKNFPHRLTTMSALKKNNEAKSE